MGWPAKPLVYDRASSNLVVVVLFSPFFDRRKRQHHKSGSTNVFNLFIPSAELHTNDEKSSRKKLYGFKNVVAFFVFCSVSYFCIHSFYLFVFSAGENHSESLFCLFCPLSSYMQLSMRTCPVSLLSMSSNSSQASTEALKRKITNAEARILDVLFGVVVYYMLP